MQPPQDSARSGSFATTPWSILFRLRYASRLSKAQEGLSSLCEIYWRPIFNHIGRHGYEFYDAQDDRGATHNKWMLKTPRSSKFDEMVADGILNEPRHRLGA
jgi:hypothetical protein